MKQRRFVVLGITVPVITIILSVFFISGVFCKNSAGSFGSSGASPLRSDSIVTEAVKSQEVFRKVYDMNKNSVVFISTEQTVKVQRHPFMDDPFFRQFFGPMQGSSRKHRNAQALVQGLSYLKTDTYAPITML
jgi:S1-C subfamily serine protease